LRIHGVQRDIARRGGERGADQFAAEPHHQSGLIDIGAGIAIPDARVRRQYLHSLGFQRDERGFVNGRDLIVREYLHRLERIAQVTVGPRAVEDGMTYVRASGPAAAAPAGRLIELFHAAAARMYWAENYYREMTLSRTGLRLSFTPWGDNYFPTICLYPIRRYAACLYPICGAWARPASGRPVAVERATASAR